MNDPKGMAEALSQIHDIACAVDENDPKAVQKALDDIIALARYEFPVLPEKRLKSNFEDRE